jgi:phosphoribosylglycinamide formyltransferase-1
MRSRVAVLASGGGSNLQSIIDHARRLGDERAFDVVVVASDRPDARALARAASAGIEQAVVASKHAPDAPSMDEVLARHDVDLVALAGYLKLVPPEVTRRFAGRLLNVHPALLPAFGGAGMYGARVHRAVVAERAATSGPTVHFVDEVYDHGATIAQWPVPVLANDDAHTLAARVLRAEHLLYPRMLQLVASGAIRQTADGRVIAPWSDPFPLLPTLDPELDDAALALALDDALAR